METAGIDNTTFKEYDDNNNSAICHFVRIATVIVWRPAFHGTLTACKHCVYCNVYALSEQ